MQIDLTLEKPLITGCKNPISVDRCVGEMARDGFDPRGTKIQIFKIDYDIIYVR